MITSLMIFAVKLLIRSNDKRKQQHVLMFRIFTNVACYSEVQYKYGGAVHFPRITFILHLGIRVEISLNL